MTTTKATVKRGFTKKIPREIDLGYCTMKVVFCSELQEKGEKHFGLTDFSTKTIYILVTDDDRFNRETLHHELVHVALQSCGLREFDRLPEEPITLGVSQMMFTMEALTPELFDWIWGRK